MSCRVLVVKEVGRWADGPCVGVQSRQHRHNGIHAAKRQVKTLTTAVSAPQQFHRQKIPTATTAAAKLTAELCAIVGRYLKQAIVDKNALVSSSALVSGILLYKISPEVCFMSILFLLSS